MVSTILYRIFFIHTFVFLSLSELVITLSTYLPESLSAEGQKLWDSPTALMCFDCYERLKAKAIENRNTETVKKKRTKARKSSGNGLRAKAIENHHTETVKKQVSHILFGCWEIKQRSSAGY